MNANHAEIDFEFNRLRDLCAEYSGVIAALNLELDKVKAERETANAVVTGIFDVLDKYQRGTPRPTVATLVETLDRIFKADRTQLAEVEAEHRLECDRQTERWTDIVKGMGDQLTQATGRITALEAIFERMKSSPRRAAYYDNFLREYALLAPTVPPETTIDPGSQYGHSKSQDKRLRAQGKPEPPAEKEKP